MSFHVGRCGDASQPAEFKAFPCAAEIGVRHLYSWPRIGWLRAKAGSSWTIPGVCQLKLKF